MMKQIKLTNGQKVKLDNADHETLSEFSWYAKKVDGTDSYIAARNVSIGGRTVTIRMHRLLSGAMPDERVRHTNGNTLDNRRTNLILERTSMISAPDPTTSLFGVRREARKFVAEIEITGRKHEIGTFNKAEDAALAYNDAAVRVYGENTPLNAAA